MSKDSYELGHVDPRLTELASLAHGTLGHMTPTQRARGLERLTARMHRDRARRPLRLVLLGGALVTAAVALALLPRVGGLATAPAPLGYTAEGCVIGPSGAIVPQAPQAGAPAAVPTVRFADGTQVKLLADTRGRLTSVDHR